MDCEQLFVHWLLLILLRSEGPDQSFVFCLSLLPSPPQGQKEDNDGIEDMYELGSEEARAHCTILSTTFRIIATVLGW